jgi:hypothetical protein
MRSLQNLEGCRLTGVSHVAIGTFVELGYRMWIACGELDPLTVALGELVFEPRA